MRLTLPIGAVLMAAWLSGCTTSKPEMMGNLGQVLMNSALPPLQETAYVFTFREEGLYSFVCSLHPNAMFGQILALPPQMQ